jgi:hypothetical protein
VLKIFRIDEIMTYQVFLDDISTYRENYVFACCHPFLVILDPDPFGTTGVKPTIINGVGQILKNQNIFLTRAARPNILVRNCPFMTSQPSSSPFKNTERKSVFCIH